MGYSLPGGMALAHDLRDCRRFSILFQFDFWHCMVGLEGGYPGGVCHLELLAYVG